MSEQRAAVPLSTYRVQLHEGFGFAALTKILPYLHQLGIDWIYASPVLAATPGSSHGYDVTHVNQLNPELGTEEEWESLHQQRRAIGMGWLQDIVPNHMAFNLSNPWIREVLRHGQASTVAKHFDIDWHHPDYRGKLMFPFLGETLEKAIEHGNVRLNADAKAIEVYDRALPISSRSLGKLAADPDRSLREVLGDQHYVLTHWRATEHAINYRRFFTVNGLICLRQTRKQTFAATHQRVVEWVKEDLVNGLRIDHVDGLRDPTGYLQQLRAAVGPNTYIAVEKILEQGERLPGQWPVQGTTGYDFLAIANQMLRDPNTTATLEELYAELTQVPSLPELGELVFANKRLVLQNRMGGELDNLVHHARGALAGLPLGMDPALLRATLSDWLCAFPVYRAYPRMGRLSEAARRILVEAADAALSMPNTQQQGLSMLRSWLRSITRCDDKTAEFLQRAMQLSGPLMAKGIEDTTFYQDARYLACNEVGDSPAFHANLSISSFHDRMAERCLTDMNASSTHDTKRAEDHRARLHTLSALPVQWSAFAKTSFALPVLAASEVPRSVQYLLLQTLVGCPDLTSDRLKAFALKALRESKTHSSWVEPNKQLEERVLALGEAMLRDPELRTLLQHYHEAATPLAWLNTLRGLVLKCTAPGSPDVYQGSEFLDYSLVDPDNRRTVDYEKRTALLHEERMTSFDESQLQWLQTCTNASKLRVLQLLLLMRRAQPDLWRSGSYVPVNVMGSHPGELLAYRRVHGDDSALVILALRTGSTAWPHGENYKEATLELPHLGRLTEQLTGSTLELSGVTQVSDLLRYAPVAVWQ